MVTDDIREFLSTEFIAKEVKVALFQMGPTKARGPNGMNALFYKNSSMLWVILLF